MSRLYLLVHISPFVCFQINAEANCTKPLCCRDFGGDRPKHVTIPTLPLGMRTCDAPGSLADSMLEAAEKLGARFSIFTGDVIDHAVWDVDEECVSPVLWRWVLV